MSLQLCISRIGKNNIDLSWECVDADAYRVYWSDSDRASVSYKMMAEVQECTYRLSKSTHVPHYIRVAAVKDDVETVVSNRLTTPVTYAINAQIEKLNRGMVAVKTANGVFLSWRLLKDEVRGYSETGMTGADFAIYKNGQCIATVTESTNYLDITGSESDVYQVGVIGIESSDELCKGASAKDTGEGFIEIPIQPPADGITPIGEKYHYNANDMSVGDVDGDGDYEFIVKWDPSNSHDVSIKGYTGHCLIDCYKLGGRLLWRLDMGPNIRAGAHYTQFMVYDFDGDGMAEMSVKTAPGTMMTTYNMDGSIAASKYITILPEDVADGVTNEDNYVASSEDYRQHLAEVFQGWTTHPEVIEGRWPSTLEACFGIEDKYDYPLSMDDACELAAYFIEVYAPAKSEKNKLDAFEGFIFKGPEYLTMFGGDGRELETIRFKYGREDDGLMWGDYAMKRIEPCNRVDRFLSGVAYLDGINPYLLIARGYYTRTTLVAYRFIDGHHEEYFSIDSGHVPMENPFDHNPHMAVGTDQVYGILAGQGNHSLSTADVDGDGCQEIIYGAAVIDHDGSVLYSSYDQMPDGSIAKMGHGDALHVAKIDPNKPGYQIFSVFEGGVEAPYGYALRDAQTGEVFFGEYAEVDLGRCMIGDISPEVPGLQVWVNDVYDCDGNILDIPLLGTNQSIRWAADMTTQVLDGVLFDGPGYKDGMHAGIINDTTHGVMLKPEGVATNNGTKGNPCLVADVFGDYREELLVRTADNKAIRIYINTELSNHKLFTMMHDVPYRVSVAWQNNCYNQPGYPGFYYASDMDWSEVMPELKGKEKK